MKKDLLTSAVSIKRSLFAGINFSQRECRMECIFCFLRRHLPRSLLLYLVYRTCGFSAHVCVHAGEETYRHCSANVITDQRPKDCPQQSTEGANQQCAMHAFHESKHACCFLIAIHRLLFSLLGLHVKQVSFNFANAFPLPCCGSLPNVCFLPFSTACLSVLIAYRTEILAKIPVFLRFD